ncbi:Phosphatidate cytidylyltransferase [Posidoniimonas polymericola]|uniref:Phosphatidate cytidylyltransferase n=1 Tax=Posidoniimonas polymericola TaxID=2528002 RepID=A0A5C5YLS3_9BACT|nr:phosphatidate cytidylyltransferase [Posidoniimonas polymericola]TWT75911.1 Phosphatidate cytidylyltransferase [Posidoniimonas polymericola]
MDPYNWALAATVVTLLAIATLIGRILQRQPNLGLNPAAVEAFNGRLRAWWIICCLLPVAFLSRPLTVFVFFGLSFWALREFITLTPTRLSDHRALFWVFFLFAPLQYVLVAYDNYQLYSVFIPVYAFLFIPLRVAIAGDPRRFLERVAKIQSGLLICVYCLSFAPALLYLKSKSGVTNPLDQSDTARLLFFFVTMVILSEAVQFAWSRLYGRNVIAPEINNSRTWEGFLGGAATTGLLGMVLGIFAPYHELWHAGITSMLISVMGFAGAMTMSAIKRDRGVRDYGTLIEGHGGVLDRIDALCFAAPVFYHFSRRLLDAI